MSNLINYDPNEELFCPPSDVIEEVLGENNLSSFTNPITRSGVDAFPVNTNYSSSQSTSDSSTNTVGTNIEESEMINPSLLTQHTGKLRIIAQPKAFYRERYCSETDPRKHRAQRFIRADNDLDKHEYPTIEIPPEWHDPNRCLFIRVTLVTVPSGKVPYMYVHPYAIHTSEDNVFRDTYNNSLYFPITKEEIPNGRKSFRISRKKMTQHDLRSYGPLHLFDSNQTDVERIMNYDDAKQIIETYQLWKSQLVFTIAEYFNDEFFPIPISSTSITSQIMCDETSRRTKLCTIFGTIFDDDTVKCAPKKGDWHGGDEILMTIPRLDRRKVFKIYFDYGSMGKFDDIIISFVDSKTIFFRTPPCLMLEAERDLMIPIIVTQTDIVIARVDFVYLTSMKTSMNLYSHCQFDLMNYNYMSNKRRYFVLDSNECDEGEMLAQQMNQLRTEEKSVESNRQSINDGNNFKFDRYLGQLQDAVAEFVRTNNPSRLFRRTRLLLAKCDQNPPPLDDAIRHGHINLAIKLIEQVVTMPKSQGLLERENHDGETPLLLAAKLNQWIVIEAILNKRLDLIEVSDKNDNNILHLLANISANKANETIKNVLLLLPNDIRTNLLEKKNKDHLTPMDVAQVKNNFHCADLLKQS